METIKVYETDCGKIKLGEQLSSLFTEKLNEAFGDGRNRKVKEAKKDLKILTEALSALQLGYTQITGEGDLDLTK